MEMLIIGINQGDRSATEVASYFHVIMECPKVLKGKSYRTANRLALLYGTLCWAMEYRHIHFMNVTVYAMLDLQAYKKEKIRNDVIGKRIGIINVGAKLLKMVWSCKMKTK